MSSIALPAWRPRAATSGLASLNRALFWALLALVILAPLPLASSRAYFWALAALYLGLVATLYALLLTRFGDTVRLPALTLPTAAFALLCLALLAQLIPFAAVPIIGDLTGPRLSVAPGMTLLMLMRQLGYGLFALLLLQVLAGPARRLQLLDLLLLGIAAYAVYAMLSLQAGDTILGMVKWAYPGVATGTFVNRNAFATFLALGAVIAAVQAAGQFTLPIGRPATGWLYLLGFAFLVLVILATQSRMGLFAALTGSALGVALLLGKSDTRFRLLAPAIAIMALLAALALLVYGTPLLDRLGTLEQDAGIRGAFYAQIIDLIAQRPLTGWGGGSFENAFPLVHRLPVDPDATWDRGHNTYLTLWAELGLLAGSLPILIVGALAVRIAAGFRRAEARHDVVPQAAALAAIAVVAIHATVDFSLEIPANAFLFLAILMAGTATLSPARHPSPTSQQG